MKFRVVFLFVLFSLSAMADVKSTNRMTMGGNSFSNTVLMKDGKIRNEMTLAPGLTTVSIQDCAGQRLIQLNDRAKTYMITEGGGASQSPTANAGTAGGTVTLSVAEQDTGERKQFFGYSARHIKGTITSEGGSGSCKGNFHVQTDGWYVDLPAMQGCAPPEREMIRSRMQRNGCNDRMVVKTSGVEKLGYPVLLDTTMDDKGNNVTIHQETTDLSTATIDANFFEIPAGYKQVQSYQELMGFGRMGSALPVQDDQALPAGTAAASQGASERSAGGFGLGTAPDAATNEVKKKGGLRIGVTQVSSSVEQSLATDGWQQQLMNNVNFLGGQAIAIPADPNDREAALEQAKIQGCDYVIFTTVTTFRTASVGQRLGGILNRGGLGGVGGSGQGRVEIGAVVKVFEPDNSVPILDGQNNFRQNDAEATAKGLLQTEARYVMLELKKRQAAK